jgi:hypothetical protein
MFAEAEANTAGGAGSTGPNAVRGQGAILGFPGLGLVLDAAATAHAKTPGDLMAAGRASSRKPWPRSAAVAFQTQSRCQIVETNL